MPLVLAESPRSLLARMADDLAACRDPWARHWLVLPGRGRGAWLQRAWAARSGIAAHSQLLAVRALVELAAAGGDRQAPFDREDLALRIAAAIPRHRRVLPLRGTAVEGELIDGRRLAWARQLADGLDMALLCRAGDALHPGLAALAADDLVAPALAPHLGQLDRAAFARRCADWIDTWEDRGGVPRLWLQLDVGLPAVLMARLVQLLQLLGEDRARVYALSPSLGYWGDLAAGRRPRPEDDAELDAGPVLGPFGRRAQDLHVQLIDAFLAEGGGEEAIASTDDGGDTLLARLQASCRAAGAVAEAASAIDDGSFGVHACRGPLRELEVCRDRILEAMAVDDTLGPDQVLVLLADPATHAPLVAAAFQSAADPADRLPLRLVGSAGSAPARIADGIRAVATALGGRCDQAQLLTLLEHPLVAARFGFDRLGVDGAELLTWLQDASFRWGADRAQRAARQGGDDPRWSLDFALRRLALGAIVEPTLRDGVVAGAAPLERAAGLGTAALAQLAALARALVEWRETWSSPTSPARWCERIRQLVEAFLAPGDAAQTQQRDALLGHALPTLAARAPACSLDADGALRLIEPLLAELDLGLGGGGGGITIAALGEYAGTPARLVVVCGLGEERFPHHDERPPWHPLAGARRRGDPARRDDDRHHLLLAVLAAEERLVLCYEGGSTADGQHRPPSTPLADLIAAATSCGGDPARFHHRHPLGGWARAAHAADRPSAARSFAQAEALGARALLDPASITAPGLWTSALPPEEGERSVTRRELGALLREPGRLLLDRLGLVLPDEEAAAERGDRFALDALQAWRARQRLLRARLAGATDDGVRGRLELAGELPPGRYGERSWATIAKEAPAWDGEPDALHPMPDGDPVTIEADGLRWVVDAAPSLPWYVDQDGGYHCFSASKRAMRPRSPAHPAKELPILRDLLLQVASRGDGVFTELRAHFATGGVLHLAAPDSTTARGLLLRLLELRELARRWPLPWDPTLHDALAKALGDGEIADQGDALRAAATEAWRDGRYGGGPPPAEREVARLCFRGLADPMDWMGPDDAAVTALPQAGLPVALRLFAAYLGWQRDALAACAVEDEA